MRKRKRWGARKTLNVIALLIAGPLVLTGWISVKSVEMVLKAIRSLLSQRWGRSLVFGMMGIFIICIPFYIQARREEAEVRMLQLQEELDRIKWEKEVKEQVIEQTANEKQQTEYEKNNVEAENKAVKQELERLKREISQRFRIVKPAYADHYMLFQKPLTSYIQTTNYGWWHQGIDMATGVGLPIRPVAKGKVIYSGWDLTGYGLMVRVEHENGYESLYAHLNKTYVAYGAKVGASSFIGEVGSTGRSTGPHLHLEVSRGGQRINPLGVLP